MPLSVLNRIIVYTPILVSNPAKTAVMVVGAVG